MSSSTTPTPAVTLHTSLPPTTPQTPLPPLLHTPAGLAILELQGTINVPDPDSFSSVPIGRLDFPAYNPNALDPTSTAWMKQVYMYVGQHQRLTGEVKKLPRALAVVRRRGEGGERERAGEEEEEELEVVDVVKYKLVFSSRPEPVTGSSGA
ncbi:putative sister chromatid cohesion protein Ctf8 [Coniochaeta sp. 2T2.1]|nr:putative sister chromatid cohesion protein Ctf8 [Coniochaeta sp. 2T2.1]